MRPLLFFFFLLVNLIPLQGKILETATFKEILDHINPHTLVVLDIDDTLLVPAQTLGTDVWFLSRLKHHSEAKKNEKLALDKALAEWEAIRHLTDIRLVESGTEEIVDQMQSKGIIVMGLTTQGLALATRTVMQLRTLSIDLSKTAPIKKDIYFLNEGHGVLFRDGILFTSGSNKGKALTTFFDMIHYHPKHVVFINDKKHHLHAVEKGLKLKKIHFTGLRYSASDERVHNFSQEIADIQWKHSTFNRILSDEEARFFLESQTDLDKGK